MQRSTVSFRMSFRWFFVVVIVWAIPLGVIVGTSLAFILGALGGTTVPELALGAAVLGATVAGEVLAALLILPLLAYYKVYVGPEGVRGFNFWGVYRFARWADFGDAAPINFLGLRFLRAHTAGSRVPLWLPLFLADWQGFCQSVRLYAGHDHPLAVALSEAGPQ